MHLSTFDRLNYLTVLAEEQNITRAARRLYISQPALTAFINHQEEALGVKLFDRSASPIRLTTAGQWYLAELRKLDNQEQQIHEKLKSISSLREHRLSFGIGRNRGSLVLPELLPALYAEYPTAQLSVMEDRDEAMSEQVMHGALDAAVIESPIYIRSLDHVALGDEYHCLITGANNPLLQGYDLTGNDRLHLLDIPPEAVSAQRFFCPSVRTGLNFRTQQLFSNYHINPREIMFISNDATAYRLAVSGAGVTYLTARHAQVTRTENRPVFMMPSGRYSHIKLYCVYRRENPSPVLAHFLSCLVRITRALYQELESCPSA